MRWTPVVAAIWLTTLAGCADRWLDSPEAMPGPAACSVGTILDTVTGTCVAAGCSSSDDCRGGYRCDLVAGICVLSQGGRNDDRIEQRPISCVDGLFRCVAGGSGRELCKDGRWTPDACPMDSTCHAGQCLTCAPSSRRCQEDGSASYQVCANDGSGWLTMACADPLSVCNDGTCQICTPGSNRCSGGNTAVCNATGTAWEESACGPGTYCTALQGSASCAPVACQPGTSRCDPYDMSIRHVCTDDGSGLIAATCAPGSACRGPAGQCIDACAIAAAEGHGTGCGYWFTQLPNRHAVPDAAREVVVLVGNDTAVDARIRITSRVLSGPVVDGLIVRPGTVAEIPLPILAIPATDFGAGFHLESSTPVAAHLASRTTTVDDGACECGGPCDENDKCSVTTTTAGGTLLLPEHLLAAPGGESTYVAWSAQHQRAELDQPALLALVGTRSGTTVVIEFTADTQVAENGEVAAYAAGNKATFVLDEGAVVQFATAASGARTTIGHGGGALDRFANDFVGTVIRSDAPIAVFTGADTYGPGVDADHQLEQLPPLSLWGRRHVGVVGGSKDTFVLLAGEKDALVGLAGPVFDMNGAPLQIATIRAFESLQVQADGDFQVRSGAPVMLAQRVARGANPDAGLVVVPPLDRSRKAHRFVVPMGSKSTLRLVAPAAGAAGLPPTVRVAGALVTDWAPLTGTSLLTARVPLCGSEPFCWREGHMEVESSEPVMGIVHEEGGRTVSYASGLGDGSGYSNPGGY